MPHWTHGLGSLLAGLLCASALPACDATATLQQEHGGDLVQAEVDPLEVLDYFPAPGVPGVPKNIQPYFFFNRAVQPEELLSLELFSPGTLPVAFTPVLDFDNAGVTFQPSTVVTSFDPFDMTLRAAETEDPLVDASSFTSAFPPGVIFNMSTSLKCTGFGGSGAQARLLNSYFDPGVYPLWIMVTENLTQNAQLPSHGRFMMGPGYIRSNGNYRIYRHVGFSTLFPEVRVEADGHFVVTQPGAFFPLDTPDKVVLTYMIDLRIEGWLDLDQSPARIRDFRLEGVFPARSLLLLADSSEDYAKAVNMLQLDVDLNGNGIPDAASFSAESQPEEIPPELYEP